MKSEFQNYLESLEITKPLLDKIDLIFRFYESVFKEEIKDIFVCDYMDAGNRQYTDLWLFSANYSCEARQFISKEDFDMTLYRGRVVYWRIQKEHYDFNDATEESRMNLKIVFKGDITGELRAAKRNCDHLKDIFSTYIMPNIIAQPI